MATPQIIKCPSILRKRWLAETSWFFGWRFLELVVQFAKIWNRDIIEQSLKCCWELLEYILITDGDSTILFKRGNTVRYLVWRWSSCLISQLVRRPRWKIIWKSLSHANKTTLFSCYPTYEGKSQTRQDLKRKTRMGEFPDSVIWQKFQVKFKGFARKRTVKGVGGEKVSHRDLDLLLPSRGDKHQKEQQGHVSNTWI